MRTMYSSKNYWLWVVFIIITIGFFSGGTLNAATISGTVTYNGNPVSALVLANGQKMFTNQVDGRYELDVPLDPDGNITLFSFVDGLAPFKTIFTPFSAPSSIMMTAATPDTPQMTINNTRNEVSGTGWVRIAGSVTYNGTPLVALVLANGQSMFTGGNTTGQYDLDVPLDENGKVTLLAFVDGLQPGKIILTGATGNNNSSGLWAGVPPFEQITQTLPNSSVRYMCENNCQNGLHRYYTTSGSAIDIVNAYRKLLQDDGWFIESVGGQEFGSGLEASKSAKYLDLNVGGSPFGIMNIDLSVWPSEPYDKSCDNCKVTDPDDDTTNPPDTENPDKPGDTGNLTSDLPTISGFNFQCDNNCGAGIHRYYTTSGNALSIAQNYAAALRANGWTIVDGPGGISIGAGLEATKGAKYLDFNAGGESTSLINVDVSVWPQEPSNKNCENCEVYGGSTDPGTGTDPDIPSGTGDLLVDVPHVYGLEPAASNDCNGGTHLYYVTGSTPQDVTPDYKSALEAKGWTVSYDGFGSSYGWGLTARKGQKYLHMNIGGFFSYHIDLCVWPSEPADDECDQDCND